MHLSSQTYFKIFIL